MRSVITMIMSTFLCKDCNSVVTRINSKQKRCNHCQKIYSIERDKQYQLNYRKKHKQKILQQILDWQEQNKEAFKRHQETYRINHKKQLSERMKIYKKSYRGKQVQLKINLNRKEKLKQIEHLFSIDDWKKKLEFTKGICPLCKKYVGIHNLTLDHIYPVSKAEKGRKYGIDDVQPLCRRCNSRKGNRK